MFLQSGKCHNIGNSIQLFILYSCDILVHDVVMYTLNVIGCSFLFSIFLMDRSLLVICLQSLDLILDL